MSTYRPFRCNLQPEWLLYIYIPAVAFVLFSLFCVSCRDPGLMERVTVSLVCVVFDRHSTFPALTLLFDFDHQG